MPLCATVYMCCVVTCWERAGLLALVCGVLLWVWHFPIGILGHIWYLIVSIPDLCTLTYYDTCNNAFLIALPRSPILVGHEEGIASPIVILVRKASMTRKWQTRTLQSNPRHREEETQCLKRPLKNRQIRGLSVNSSLMEVESIAECSPLEHSAILFTCIKR